MFAPLFAWIIRGITWLGTAALPSILKAAITYPWITTLIVGSMAAAAAHAITTSYLQQALSAWTGIPADMMQVLTLLRVPEALSVLASAIATRAALKAWRASQAAAVR